jgi:hypothetical protein
MISHPATSQSTGVARTFGELGEDHWHPVAPIGWPAPTLMPTAELTSACVSNLHGSGGV